VHCRWADEVWANRTALELACRTADRKGQASTHNNLGTAYERLGHYPEALKHLQQALALFQELEDHHSQAANLTNLGIVFWRLGHHVEALEHHQQAPIIYRKLGDRHSQAQSLNNLGEVLERWAAIRRRLSTMSMPSPSTGSSATAGAKPTA
jgi:tetratricopeptide (TPR) repeat protein